MHQMTVGRVSRASSIQAGIVIISVFFGSLTSSFAQCRSGDQLIGEDENNYYCSSQNCQQIESQVKRDQDAIKRLGASILKTNAELQNWAAENAKASDRALQDATAFLGKSVVDALKDMGEARLAAVEREFRKKLPFGTTWQMQITRVQDLRSRSARLNGALDGLKLATLPGVDPVKWWRTAKGWATNTKSEVEALKQTMKELVREKGAAEIISQENLKFSAEALSLALSPLVAKQVSFGDFIVNYGYDVKQWLDSKALIEKNIMNQEHNRIAMCKLSVQLEKSVRDNNICHKKYPAPGAAPPDPARCI